MEHTVFLDLFHWASGVKFMLEAGIRDLLGSGLSFSFWDLVNTKITNKLRKMALAPDLKYFIKGVSGVLGDRKRKN